MANSRIPKLNALAKYEIISIRIKKVEMTNGTPFGRNRLNNFQHKLLIPARLIATKWAWDRKNANKNELVIVNVNGPRPIILAIKITKKVYRREIKKYWRFTLRLSDINFLSRLVN